MLDIGGLTLFQKSKLIYFSTTTNSTSIVYATNELLNFKIKKLIGFSFSDFTAADFLDRSKRYALIYTLLNSKYSQHLRISKDTNITEFITSVSLIFPAAVAAEREIYDMFGLFFNNHNDLRRILTDYGFKGHPLRKDFPLSGYNQISYSPLKKCLLFRPLILNQTFRSFEFNSVWNTNIHR